MGVRWNLKVVLICISLMTKGFEHFLSASQPFEIPLLRILCLALYPIFLMELFVLLMAFTAVNRHHDQGNSYKDIYLELA